MNKKEAVPESHLPTHQEHEHFFQEESREDELAQAHEEDGPESIADVGETHSGKGSGKKKESELHEELQAFLKTFNEQTNPEEKLVSIIDFMEAALAQGGTPRFKNFWEVRKLCLPLFKENIAPAVRSQLWNKYSELSKEARRLKDILDEQSAFAVEQIEMAVKALESDIEYFKELVEKSSFQEESLFPSFLKGKIATYKSLQKQLNVLNVQASRINGLRKELLKTEMRVRQKNKFFQRLSTAGDKVFPLRKELIKQISNHFIEDVDQFVQENFKDELVHDPSLYALREEIKALQSIAKILTLNTHAFTQTRMRLSECWDKIKVKEKERKKEKAQQKTIFKQNAEKILAEVNDLKAHFESSQLSSQEASKKIEDISRYMRKVELGREEIGLLKESLNEVRKAVLDKAQAEDQEKQQQERERSRQRKEQHQALKNQIDHLVNKHDKYDVDTLTAEREKVLSQIQESQLTKLEKQELEKSLRSLKDIIADKKEKAQLDLSEDDRQALQQLQEILNQRKSRRNEIKNQLEALRKAAGSSSLDFEKAMSYNTQISEEKERLDKISQGIKEIEIKISKLQSGNE